MQVEVSYLLMQLALYCFIRDGGCEGETGTCDFSNLDPVSMWEKRDEPARERKRTGEGESRSSASVSLQKYTLPMLPSGTRD